MKSDNDKKNLVMNQKFVMTFIHLTKSELEDKHYSLYQGRLRLASQTTPDTRGNLTRNGNRTLPHAQTLLCVQALPGRYTLA